MEVTAMSEKSVIVSKAKTSVDEDETQIHIPVINNIIASKYSLLGKLIWMAIILACSVTMFVNVVKRFQYYMSSPLALNIRIERQTTMFYPAITICHEDFWRKAAFTEIQQEIGNVTGIEPSNVTVDDILQYMDIMDLWQRVAFRLEDIVFRCVVEATVNCTSIGEWRTLISVSGICYTFYQSKPVNVSGNGYGMSILLGNSKLTESERESWRILLHDPQSSPKLSMFTEGFTVSSRQAVNAKIRLHKFSSVPTPNNPCSNVSVADCKVSCLSDLTLQRASCRLPFMENVNATYCAPPNHKIADDLLKSVLLGNQLLCTCNEECNVDKFDVSVDTLYYPNARYSRLYIFYQNFFYLAVREDLCYEFIALLADVGGTLGFFMGMSLLTIVEIMEALIFTLKKSARKLSVSKKSTGEESIDVHSLYGNVEDVTTHL